MQNEKQLLGRKKLFFLQMPNLQRYWNKIRNKFFLSKRNLFVETSPGRCNPIRYSYEKARRIWDAVYERTGLEKILQSREGSKETAGIPRSQKAFIEGRDTGVSERERKRARLAKLFESEDFKLFLDWLIAKEDEALNQLVVPTAKPNSEMGYENYSWYLRGELNAYLQIRSKVESDIYFKNKKLIENTEGDKK